MPGRLGALPPPRLPWNYGSLSTDSVGGEQLRNLGAIGHVELAVGRLQVQLDRARTKEQEGRDLAT